MDLGIEVFESSTSDCDVQPVLRTTDTEGLIKQSTLVVGRTVNYEYQGLEEEWSDSLHALGFFLGDFARFQIPLFRWCNPALDQSGHWEVFTSPPSSDANPEKQILPFSFYKEETKAHRD